MELELLQRLCAERKVKWSIHAAEQMMVRGIDRIDVINCLQNGEVIEDYPDDFPHPSCLVFGKTVSGNVLHTVVGSDGLMLYVITAYFPDTDRFESDFRTRKAR